MQRYDELLQKNLYLFKIYRIYSPIVVKKDGRPKPGIVQVLMSGKFFESLILEPMEKELLALSKSIGVMHQQVRSILAWEDPDVVDEPRTDPYRVWKSQADLFLDLNLLDPSYVKASDLTILLERVW